MSEEQRRYIKLPSGQVYYLPEYPTPDIDEEDIDPDLRAYIKHQAQVIAQMEVAHGFMNMPTTLNPLLNLLPDITNILTKQAEIIKQLQSEIEDLQRKVRK